jgi:hypothetical protein
VRLSFVSIVLLAAGSLSAGPQPEPEHHPQVGIFLKFDNRPSQDFIRLMRSYVNFLFRPSGLNFQWISNQEQEGNPEHDHVLQVRLRGRCAPSYAMRDWGAFIGKVPLGWTAVNGKEVLPEIGLDCDQIARFASAGRTAAGSLSAHVVYARVVGRVMAHEILHVLLGTTEHSGSDFRRRVLHERDLMLPGRLNAEELTQLRRLGRSAPASPAAAPSPTWVATLPGR